MDRRNRSRQTARCRSRHSQQSSARHILRCPDASARRTKQSRPAGGSAPEEGERKSQCTKMMTGRPAAERNCFFPTAASIQPFGVLSGRPAERSYDIEDLHMRRNTFLHPDWLTLHPLRTRTILSGALQKEPRRTVKSPLLPSEWQDPAREPPARWCQRAEIPEWERC